MKPERKVSEVKLVYLNEYKSEFVVSSSQQAYELFLDYYDKDTKDLKESFRVLYLNRSNQPLGMYFVSLGNIAGTTVDVSHIVLAALMLNSSGVLLSHNHPSGSLEPSAQDKKVTERIRECLQMFDKTLFDHIILTSNGYFSFADENLL